MTKIKNKNVMTRKSMKKNAGKCGKCGKWLIAGKCGKCNETHNTMKKNAGKCGKWLIAHPLCIQPKPSAIHILQDWIAFVLHCKNCHIEATYKTKNKILKNEM